MGNVEVLMRPEERKLEDLIECAIINERGMLAYSNGHLLCHVTRLRSDKELSAKIFVVEACYAKCEHRKWGVVDSDKTFLADDLSGISGKAQVIKIFKRKNETTEALLASLKM